MAHNKLVHALPVFGGLRFLDAAAAGAFSVADVLVLDAGERPITDDLQHHFEAVGKLSKDERAIARALLEGLVLKHDAKRFERTVKH